MGETCIFEADSKEKVLQWLKDFTNIADFMKLKEDYFTKLLNLENGTP